MKKHLSAAIFVFAALSQPANAACSAATLNGSWSVHYSGISFSQQKLCAGIGLISFSSNGQTANVSAVKESCNGTTNSGSGSGTYTIASSCMGTVSVTSNAGRVYSFNMVVSQGGTMMDFILTTSGATLTGVMTKI